MATSEWPGDTRPIWQLALEARAHETEARRERRRRRRDGTGTRIAKLGPMRRVLWEQVPTMTCWIFRLECGHYMARAISIQKPERVRCIHCKRKADKAAAKRAAAA